MGVGVVRPRLVVFDHCKHIRMDGVTVQNSPFWQIVPYYSDDIRITNIKVLADPHSPNTDAIDPFSSTNVIIDHVFADTGDDDIAIKSGQINSPGPDSPSANITITHCTFFHGHGISVGSEIAGGAHDILASDIHFKGTDNGVRVKANRDRGNDIGPLTYTDLDMEDVGSAIVITEFYPKIPNVIDEAPVTRLTPHFHDITITNLWVKNAKEAGVVVGLPESPITNLKLHNVSIDSTKGLQLKYAQVNIKNVDIRSVDGYKVDIGPGVVQLPPIK